MPDALAAYRESRAVDWVTVPYGGADWQIPADVDRWPLAAVLDVVLSDQQGRLAVDRPAVLRVLAELLGEQFDAWAARCRRRGDIVPMSHAVAEAAGFARTVAILGDPMRDDVAFGSLPRLLWLLQCWPDKCESDLLRFWHLDYCDRWRFDAEGRRRLTLRRINACLMNPPDGSALGAVLGRRSTTELVVMDLFEAITGKPHPARPLRPDEIAARDKLADEAAKRAKQRADYRRRHGIAGGLDTARQNARAVND